MMSTLASPAADELLFEIRSNLNQTDPSNSFWTDEEILSYVNAGIRRYFAEVVHHAEGHFETQTDLDITNNVETVALPADFFKVRALNRKVNGGFVPLTYRNNLMTGYSNTGGASGDAYLPYYYLRGNSLVLRPVPNTTELAGLRLEYVQFPDTMLTGGDTMTAQVSPVFRDLIVAYAVYRAKVKESQVTGTMTYGPAKEIVNDLFIAFKEVIGGMSDFPTSIDPFSPEEF